MDDLFSVTNTITVEDLIKAYEIGVFPWPHEDVPEMIPWFSPRKRGVLFFDQFHVSKSNKKLIKKKNFKVTFCKAFDEVIKNCASVKRKDDSGTWINDCIIKSYVELFKQKKAYSVEVWSPYEKLIGGMYGVISKTYVSGESMFFFESGASKFALISLVEKLKSLGLSYLDTQMVSPLVQTFGGVEIAREDFVKMIISGRIIDSKNRPFFKELIS